MCTAGARGGAGEDPRRKTGALTKKIKIYFLENGEKRKKTASRRGESSAAEGRKEQGTPCRRKGCVRGPGAERLRAGGRSLPVEDRLGAEAGPGPGPPRGRRAPCGQGLSRERRPGAAASFRQGEFGRRGEEGQYL